MPPKSPLVDSLRHQDDTYDNSAAETFVLGAANALKLGGMIVGVALYTLACVIEEYGKALVETIKHD